MAVPIGYQYQCRHICSGLAVISTQLFGGVAGLREQAGTTSGLLLAEKIRNLYFDCCSKIKNDNFA